MCAPLKAAVTSMVALTILAGCAAGPESPLTRATPDEAAAPRALLAKWHRALVTGDKPTYLACFTGPQDDLVLALAGLEAVQASYAFHEAVVGAYGPEAWKVFETSDSARVDLFPREDKWTGRITVVPMREIAFAYLPKGRVPMHLAREGGEWHILAASLAPPGIEAKRAADYLFRWAASLRKLIPQITAKGVAADKATRDMSEDFKARIAPAERPAAAEAVQHMLAH